MYEQVKKKFANDQRVVFLAISTDEDRGVVRPFIDAQRWTKTVYFEDGLSAALRISAIPTAMIFGKNGDVVSRMNGFVPDRFIEMLTERITQALAE